MCGIAGYFSTGEGSFPSAAEQQSVLDRMRMRGPDGVGTWREASQQVVLLHRRLAIQDLTETGAQPMHSADGNLVIIFNGEIYNAPELRTWVPDYPFRGTSDTEVILAMYQAYGREMLPFLRGMFAFAIWDAREHGLLLARDAYGIKPLYLATTSTGLWFASQVKALLEVAGVDRAPSPAGHAGFFLWGSIPEPHTLYRGIRSLRSGFSLWLRRGVAPEEKQFVSLAQTLAQVPGHGRDVPLGSRIRSAVTSSVRAHFISDVPVAIFLSAGLDSSTILATAAGQFPAGDLTALSLGFDAYQGTALDETREAAQIAQHYGIAQVIDLVRKQDFEAEVEPFLHAMDQPTIDGINSYFIARMARRAGFKVALSGVGGDELFGGYGTFRQVPQMMNLVAAMGVSRRFGGSIRRWSEDLVRRFTSPKFAGVLEYGDSIHGAYLLRRGLFMPWELPGVLDPDLAAAGLEELDNQGFDQQEFAELDGMSLHAKLCFLESARYMRNQLLWDADWAGMAHSLEIRTPLVDQFLLAQLSGAIRSRTPPNKRAMAGSLDRGLPAHILERRKTGFSVPVREWLAEAAQEKPERGLRSWAKFVYQRQWKDVSGERPQGGGSFGVDAGGAPISKGSNGLQRLSA